MQFSFTRFKYLMAYQWAQYSKRYMYSLLAITIASIGFQYIYAKLGTLQSQVQVGIYITGLVLIGLFFTSTLFQPYASSKNNMQAYMLPASALEKLSVGVVYSMILFPIVGSIIFFLTNKLMVYISFHYMHRWTITMDPQYYKWGILWYTVAASGMTVFSVIFKRNAFLLYIIFCGLLYFSGLTINDSIGTYIMEKNANPPRHYEGNPALLELKPNGNNAAFWSAGYAVYNHDYKEYVGARLVVLPTKQQNMFYYAALLLCPFLWLITLTKIREKAA
ncbi:hypothetical protein LX64_00357 [Chitinophaga skermanii]|uniref:ABC-2 family transporter n=1 Tax=Chitinophaga skermanii TaxID=331697 RepID=A0A327R265_9BACT|nr:hypothetical protein [Chitinophaga skermanii]RAJ10750.1 hypothetical protein LX64_00357 [Chitinophaga skermanii]